MSRGTSHDSDPRPSDPRTLADRVKARVALAQTRLDQRAADASSDLERRRSVSKKPPVLANGSAGSQQVEALQVVYREMRTVYRSYRRRTGTPAVPELRSAVRAFRRGQSLTSLVDVAAFLDDRKLLAW